MNRINFALLDDVCEFILDGTHGSPKRTESGYPVLSAQNVKDGQLSFETNRFTDQEEYDKYAKRLRTKKGDVLLTIVGTIGRVGLLHTDQPFIFQRSVAVLRTKPSICDNRYLFRVLDSPNVKQQLDSLTNKSSQAGIYLKKLKTVEIPLPPLAEQQRIAAILDKADALRSQRRAALAKLDTLLQSTFLHLFGDPVTNPMNWEVGSIDMVVREKSDVRCGPFGTQLKVDELVDEGIPIFGIENVHNNRFVSNTSKFVTPEKAKQLKSFGVKNGDVLVTRMGTIGRACVVAGLEQEARISYHLFRVRPDKNKCLPKFLSSTICRSGTFQEQLRRLSHGAIMSGLSTSNLREVKFLLPPIDEQQKYIQFVENAEKHKQYLLTSMTQLDNLFHALQQRAFHGQLPSSPPPSLL